MNFHIQNIELYPLIIIFTKQRDFFKKKRRKLTYNIDVLVLMSLHYTHVYNSDIVDVFLIDIDLILDLYDLKDIDKDLNQLNLNLTDVKDMNNHP